MKRLLHIIAAKTAPVVEQCVLEEEYALKDVRFWFYKGGPAKFISHLDTYRCMLKAIRRTKLPIWYTEGFNSHPFMTFTMPLPLGVRGANEAFDVRMCKESVVDKGEFINEINEYLPYKIFIKDILDPIMDPSCVRFALFKIQFADDILTNNEIIFTLSSFLEKDDITVFKRTKAGQREINLKEHIKSYSINTANQKVYIDMILPSGNLLNINPFLFTEALKSYCNSDIYCDITRVKLLDEVMNEFN